MFHHFRQGNAAATTDGWVAQTHGTVVLTPQVPTGAGTQGHAGLSGIHDSVVHTQQVLSSTETMRGWTVIARAVQTAPIVHRQKVLPRPYGLTDDVHSRGWGCGGLRGLGISGCCCCL